MTENPLRLFWTRGDVLTLWLHLVGGPLGNTRLYGEEVATVYPVVGRMVSCTLLLCQSTSSTPAVAIESCRWSPRTTQMSSTGVVRSGANACY